MSLATRCIHCGTIFKIVEDQLKVSQGWVRCGRCNEVFNALPTLFDMDREPPPPRPASAPRPDARPSPETSSQSAPQAPPPVPYTAAEPKRSAADELPLEPRRSVQAATDFELDTYVPTAELRAGHMAPPDEQLNPPEAPAPYRVRATEPYIPAPPPPAPSPLAPTPLPEAQLPSTDEADALDSRYLMPSDRERVITQRRQHGPEFADAEFPFDAMLDARADDAGTPHAAETAHGSLRGSSADKAIPKPKPAPITTTPEFIRQAQRLAFWRHPSIRGLLTGLILALMVSLATQVVHHYRDHLAAQHATWRNGLTQWCSVAQCTLKPPLSIHDLQVESAKLLRAESDGTHRYRLTVTIQNRADIALSWPHVDLILTDTAGAVVARRSLPPEQAKWSDSNTPAGTFAKRPSAVPPRSSTTLTWYLRAPSLRPAGYTAELFYP